jgi:hypothetical protein
LAGSPVSDMATNGMIIRGMHCIVLAIQLSNC